MMAINVPNGIAALDLAPHTKKFKRKKMRKTIPGKNNAV
jgi:hypothetical protein